MKWKEIRSKVRGAVAKARPVTNAVERVASLAVHLRGGITPMGAVGLMSAAVNAIASDSMTAPCAPSSGRDVCCSMESVAAALQASGWKVAKVDEEKRWTRLTRAEETINVHADGDLYADDAATFTAVEVALDAFLPKALRISHGDKSWIDVPADMNHYETEHGAEIARLIKAHAVDGPRCVLLKGRPGTGKTTMVREIVDRIAMGRALFLDANVFGNHRDQRSLAIMRPAVVVVDDIDKIESFGCTTVEALRRAAPIVLLTANNGDNDEVIDGAMGRPGRIDEVFAIEAEPFPREAPFDLLTDEEWQDVQAWPVASVNELRRRLEIRGRAGMRLDDLRDRVGRRVRSLDVLA